MKSWSKLVSAYEDAESGKIKKVVTKRDPASPEMRKKKRNQSFNKRTWIRC
jgi:hypothetical protein